MAFFNFLLTAHIEELGLPTNQRTVPDLDPAVILSAVFGVPSLMDFINDALTIVNDGEPCNRHIFMSAIRQRISVLTLSSASSSRIAAVDVTNAEEATL